MYFELIGYRYDIDKFDTEFSLSEDSCNCRYHLDSDIHGIRVECKGEDGWYEIGTGDISALERIVERHGYFVTKEKAREAALSLLRNKQSGYINKVEQLTKKIASIQKLLDA
jgi:hypothetical protein